MIKMKVITCNLNGIRAAERKGFFTWIAAEDPDFICVQETKAQMGVLLGDAYYPVAYNSVFADAVKKGYSGVGIYSKLKPDQVVTKMGLDWADNEGRYVEASFGNLRIASLYLPSGSSGNERQELKYDFMRYYHDEFLVNIATGEHDYILCGDFNIVHKEIDIKNWKANQKNSGCLPCERQWLDEVFGKLNLVDAFRHLNANSHEYTWWSNRGRAWDNNVGWRLDYQIVTKNLAAKIKAVRIYKEQRFSDHAPLIVEYANY
jgi:exodeoxyribonuclease-3